MSKLVAAVLTNATIQAVSASASRLITITGVNARTFTVNHTSEMVTDDNVLASKTGTGTSSASGRMVSVLWEAPNGNQIAATVMKSTYATGGDRFLDMRGILYQIVQDFPYLDDGLSPTDPNFADVVLLTGGDGGFTDESSYARTLTASGATRTTSDILFGSHSYSFDGTDDRIEMADAAELSFGTGDFAVEFWFRGSGSDLGSLAAFVSKYNTGANQREWTVQYTNVTKEIVAFASTNGTANSFASFDLDGQGGMTSAAFFNGAKRHILLRRSGTEIAIYVNGVKGSAVYNIGASSLHAGTAKAMMGARETGAGAELFLPGKLDEIRITKGNARQTAAKFTPVARPYPRS
jgi:hypothetical protein